MAKVAYRPPALLRKKPPFNYEKWMLLLFPLITLGLFIVAIILLWAIDAFLMPLITG